MSVVKGAINLLEEIGYTVTPPKSLQIVTDTFDFGTTVFHLCEKPIEMIFVKERKETTGLSQNVEYAVQKNVVTLSEARKADTTLYVRYVAEFGGEHND